MRLYNCVRSLESNADHGICCRGVIPAFFPLDRETFLPPHSTAIHRCPVSLMQILERDSRGRISSVGSDARHASRQSSPIPRELLVSFSCASRGDLFKGPLKIFHPPGIRANECSPIGLPCALQPSNNILLVLLLLMNISRG